jgi:hypothetical protein
MLPFALSTANLPKQPSLSSGLLPVILLHRNQPPPTFINSTNNIPSDSDIDHIPNANPQVKTEANPPQPPLSQIQETPQQTDTFPTHDIILTITGGSNTNFDSKRQQRDYYRQVNHVAVKGPITQTKWSHMIITFSAPDVSLTSFPHTDGMVVTIDIDRWDVAKILVDNGSRAEIIFSVGLQKNGL